VDVVSLSLHNLLTMHGYRNLKRGSIITGAESMCLIKCMGKTGKAAIRNNKLEECHVKGQ